MAEVASMTRNRSHGHRYVKTSRPILPPAPELDWADLADQRAYGSPRSERHEPEYNTRHEPESIQPRRRRHSRNSFPEVSSASASGSMPFPARVATLQASHGYLAATRSTVRSGPESIPRSVSRRSASYRNDDLSPSAEHHSSRLVPRRHLFLAPESEADTEPASSSGSDQGRHEVYSRTRHRVIDGSMHRLEESRRGDHLKDDEQSTSSSRVSPSLDPREGRVSSRHDNSALAAHARSSASQIVVQREDPQVHNRAARPSRSVYRHHEIDAGTPHRSNSMVQRGSTGSGMAGGPSRSVASSSRRSSSFLGTFFGPGLQPPSDRPTKIVECVVCMDDRPSHKTAKLKCGHRMCNSCLKRSFKLSVTDPQHMPPKCCTSDVIPLKHVDRLFDTDFKRTWNKKLFEFTAQNRTYCPSRRCGEFIRPEDMRVEEGRKQGKCSQCKTKVCVSCGRKWHTSRHCPKDEETKRLLAQAKTEGWQRCFRCKAMVELSEGCNHMTCRCGAEFCMVCGTRWKQCACPWFNYDAVEQDRLAHLQFPLDLHEDRNSLDARVERLEPGNPFDYAIRPHPRSYEEEMLSRRRQDAQDLQYAQRLQTADGLGYRYVERPNAGIGHTSIPIGTSPRRLVDHGSRVRPRDARGTSTHRSTTRAESPSEARSRDGANYISGIARARGVLASNSMEQRLADRFDSSLRSNSAQRVGVLHCQHPSLQPSLTMPMIPVMPMVPQLPPTLQRRSTTETISKSRQYSHAASVSHESESEDEVLQSVEESDNEDDSKRGSQRNTKSLARHRLKGKAPKQSAMAGLNGPGSGMGRVTEWREHVEPGVEHGQAASMTRKRS